MDFREEPKKVNWISGIFVFIRVLLGVRNHSDKLSSIKLLIRYQKRWKENHKVSQWQRCQKIATTPKAAETKERSWNYQNSAAWRRRGPQEVKPRPLKAGFGRAGDGASELEEGPLDLGPTPQKGKVPDWSWCMWVGHREALFREI